MFAGKLAMMALAPVGIAAATAATAYLIASRCCAQSAGDGDDKAPDDKAPDNKKSDVDSTDHEYVRPAGPKQMENPPKEDWSEVDEASDESFPASDPPGRY